MTQPFTQRAPCGCVEHWEPVACDAYAYWLFRCPEHWVPLWTPDDQATCHTGQDMYSGDRQQPNGEESR